MSVLQAIYLGLIQGITEFLPISSSGHLVIFQQILGITGPTLVFDTILHLGTLVAIIIYFFPTIRSLTRKTILLVLIGTIPAGIVGVFFEDRIESLFGSLTAVGLGLIFTAVLLLWTKNKSQNGISLNGMSYKQALIIGCIQALAIIPGISRSGSTLVSGLFLGLNRLAAFTYSFYLAIPAIGGAFILQLEDLLATSPTAYLSLFLGFVSAIFGGLVSISILKRVLQSFKLYYFGYYCFIVGIMVLLFTLIG